MKVSFSGKQVDVSDKLRKHVEDGLATSVDKYFSAPISCSVAFSKEGEDFEAENTVHPTKNIVLKGSGSASEIAAKIKENIDLDPRVTVLGHIQRGGVPTGRDRVNATKMGYLAVELLLAGKTNRIVATNQGGYTDIDIDEALSMHKDIQKMEVDVLAAMTGI